MIYVNDTEFKGIKEHLGKDKKKVTFLIHSSQYSSRLAKKNDSVVVLKSATAGTSIPAQYNSDILTGVADQIRYVENLQKVRMGSEVKVNYTPVNIQFEDGKLEVPASRADLIWFLRNHPNNETNPKYEDKYAERPNRFIFREKNIQAEKKVAYASIKAEVDTKDYIIKLKKTDTQELYESISQFKEPFDEVGTEGAKEMLIQYASRIGYHKFDEYAKSQRRVFNSIVNRAIDYDIIAYQETPKTRFWKWVGGQQICMVPKGIDKMDHLYVTVMKKDSSGLLSKLKELVEEKELELESA